MRSTISGHLRDNVVGYVALFLVLTSGTAYALDGSNTVFTDDIVDGEVRNGDIRQGAVTTGKIANGDVRTEDLAPDSVVGDRVLNGALGGADLADRSIGGQKVGFETLAGVNVNDGSLFGADIANDSLGAADIATGAIGASEIGGAAVGTGELDPAAFNSTDIAPKSLADQRYEITSNAIQSDEVSDNSLTGADIAESSIDTPEAAFAKSDSGNDLPADNTEEIIAQRIVEPGNYVVLAKSSLISSGGEFVDCRLRVVRPGLTTNLDTVTNPTVKKSFGLPGAYEEVSMIGLIGYSGGNIELHFLCRGAGVTTDETRLVALKVNRFVGTDAP